MNSIDLPVRMRRLRGSNSIRALVRETKVDVQDLVFPLFIKEDIDEPVAIESMPGIYQLPLNMVSKEVKELQKLGINAVMLFGIPKQKDASGTQACNDEGVIQTTIKIIKDTTPELLVISDLCFCEYTSHGHCGILQGEHLDNDKTLEALNIQAISHAKAGSAVIAPSGMIDGMVKSIRTSLDMNSYKHIPILSYAVKYCSSFYGPFREAAEGAPQFGSRDSYQMDIANSKEAIREAQLDIAEGTDMLMVKPAMTYQDIIYKIKQEFSSVPLGAYQVSGEYSMIKAAAKVGYLDENKAMLESLTSIKRSGADFIITYYAKQFAKLYA